MREILRSDQLAKVSAGDPMIVWAGQGFSGGVRAWYDGEAVAVASPELSKRDRLAVSGPVDAVARLTADVYAEVGTNFRPFGDEQLIRNLADRVPGMSFAAAFGWMDTRTAPTHEAHSPAQPHAQPAPQSARSEGLVSGGGPAWLDDDAGVEALLAQSAPAS